MRNATPSSYPLHTICKDVGSPAAVNPFGSDRAQRSRRLTMRVNTAGLRDWSTAAIGMGGVVVVGVNSASILARTPANCRLSPFSQSTKVVSRRHRLADPGSKPADLPIQQ